MRPPSTPPSDGSTLRWPRPQAPGFSSARGHPRPPRAIPAGCCSPPPIRRVLPATARTGRMRAARPAAKFHPGPKASADFDIEHFPAKWEPVRRRKCDQIKNLGRVSVSIETKRALAASLLRRNPDRLGDYGNARALMRDRCGEFLRSAEIGGLRGGIEPGDDRGIARCGDDVG